MQVTVEVGETEVANEFGVHLVGSVGVLSRFARGERCGNRELVERARTSMLDALSVYKTGDWVSKLDAYYRWIDAAARALHENAEYSFNSTQEAVFAVEEAIKKNPRSRLVQDFLFAVSQNIRV